MRPNFRWLGFVAAAFMGWLVCASAAQAAIALPNVQYIFTGVCSDCSGVGLGHLFLKGTYQRGNPIQGSDFVSFDYASDLFSINAVSADTISINGIIPVLLPASIDLTFFDQTQNELFTSSAKGAWQWCFSFGQGCFSGDADFGVSSTWSAAPEPASMTVVVSGLLGLRLARRRGRGQGYARVAARA